MCDYSEAEIRALESAFPSTRVYICDFHREQSWGRWVKDHKHGLTSDEGYELLDLLRSCAWAPPCSSSNEEQTEDHFYLQAVERLKVSQVWLQQWLNNYWLCIPKVVNKYALLIHTYTCTVPQYTCTYTQQDIHVHAPTVTLVFTPSHNTHLVLKTQT